MISISFLPTLLWGFSASSIYFILYNYTIHYRLAIQKILLLRFFFAKLQQKNEKRKGFDLYALISP